MADFDLYRKSLCGESLNEALNKFVDDGKITPDLAKKVLIQFEKSMGDALSTKSIYNTTFKGRLQMYRLDENDWTFILTDVKFWVWDSKFQEVSLEEVLFEEHVDMVKIVAKNPPRS